MNKNNKRLEQKRRLEQKNKNYRHKKLYIKFHIKKSQAVNFNNIEKFNNYSLDNTIEFRCPNGSLDPVIWQNNVNLFVNILKYSKSPKYDDDVITKRHEFNQDKYSSLRDYKEIYLEQALELCDMVFNNNFDKVYFLRQYLKSFQTGIIPLEKSKKFTKQSISF